MSPQATAIVSFLEERGPSGANNVELTQIPGHFCQRFGARLWEARQEGYQFGKRREGKGTWRYWLVSKPMRNIAGVQMPLAAEQEVTS